ncbi:MAG: hypothetical protein WC365_06880 [Candidatus Babeliales bacterium]|jgi:hypothetical protein
MSIKSLDNFKKFIKFGRTTQLKDDEVSIRTKVIYISKNLIKYFPEGFVDIYYNENDKTLFLKRVLKKTKETYPILESYSNREKYGKSYPVHFLRPSALIKMLKIKHGRYKSEYSKDVDGLYVKYNINDDNEDKII